LDIYGTAAAYREAFEYYTGLISGALVIKQGLPITPRLQPGVKMYTYCGEWTPADNASRPDFYASNIRVADGTITFDFNTPDGIVADVRLGVPVWVNIENAVAAMSVACLCGADASCLQDAMASFRGVQRRFNIHVNTAKVVYVDDYAHHPQEIATSISSVRKVYPDRKLIGVFQPHLYTRTRDFADGFAQVLSTLDECVLLPIYPARELPIEGITTEIIANLVVKPCRIVEREELAQTIGEMATDVVVSFGAGNIDACCESLAEAIKRKTESGKRETEK
jgi:UDP-N-acetylmuramate--alanine ligase